MGKSKRTKQSSSKPESSTIKKLFEYHLKSLSLPVVELVTENSCMSWISAIWNSIWGVKMVGFKAPDPSFVDKNGNLKAPWTIENELSSKLGKLLRTPASIIGRITNLYKCSAFYTSSLIEILQIIMVTEQKLYFEDLRRLLRYVFGITDMDLYILLGHLYRECEICVVANGDERGNPVGPFIIQSMYTNPDTTLYHLKMMQESFENRDEAISKDEPLFEPEIDPDTRTDMHKGNTWFWYDSFIAIDELLVRMFASIDDELDDVNALTKDIPQYNALERYFNSDDNPPIDECYPYLLELLNIKSGDDVTLSPNPIKADRIDEIVKSYKQYKKGNADKIKDIVDKNENCTDYFYDFSDPKTFEEPTETATEDDIREAIELLNANQDTLRKDRKTGKVINAEKIVYILNEISQIFSLKSLYKVFEAFDTDPEVVRRDIRKLENDKRIVMAKRGLYCSVEYADLHAKKNHFTLGAMFTDDDEISGSDLFDDDESDDDNDK